MTVAALLDLGADEKKLLQVLETVPADGFTVELSRVKKSGLDCQDFDVKLDEAHENHDHDMEYLHGHEHEADDHEHHHEAHEHDGHEHHHEHGHHHLHRHLADVNAIIDGTQMTDRARALAKKIFRILAEAEAKAHGLPLEEVHFHEVGAIDSIVDVISIAVCFDDINITDVIVKSVTEGCGTIRCQHGILPVPVPAVTNIAQRYALPMRIADVRGEFVTPTGAAFLAAVKTKESLPERFRIVKTGLGAGKREYALPGLLRAMIVEG